MPYLGGSEPVRLPIGDALKFGGDRGAPRAYYKKAAKPHKSRSPRAHAGQVKRYNPYTGVRTYVDKNTDEADSWPSRKPKVSSRWKKLQDAALTPLGGETARVLFPSLKSAGKSSALILRNIGAVPVGAIAGAASRLKGSALAGAARIGGRAGKAGAALIGLSAPVAVALGGLAAGYYGTKWIMEAREEMLDAKNPTRVREEQKVALALKFQAARREAAESLGRPITKTEMGYLASDYKDALKQLEKM